MIVVLMGVAGSGKTTVGKLLAAELGWEFADGDDFHSAANIAKMRSGIPLTDLDRAPWLATLRGLIADWIAAGKSGVLACSALRRAYREQLRVSPDVQVVYLKGDAELFRTRLQERAGHYMKEGMLASQLATLEEPTYAVVVDATAPPEEIVREIRAKLRLPV